MTSITKVRGASSSQKNHLKIQVALTKNYCLDHKTESNIESSDLISKLKLQNMSIEIESGDERYLDLDYSLFEDETINIDVNLELYLEFHPDYGRSVKEIKVGFLSAYNNEECEDILPTPREIKEIEDFLQYNLLINLS